MGVLFNREINFKRFFLDIDLSNQDKKIFGVMMDRRKLRAFTEEEQGGHKDMKTSRLAGENGGFAILYTQLRIKLSWLEQRNSWKN